MSVFTPADILLPADDISLELWSVVACDQFSSERAYWERVKERVGESPSTLNMIIPEVYLEDIDEGSEIKKIRRFMDDYISQGMLREIRDSFIYVERTQSDGQVRKGLVGALDLEEYAFSVTDTDVGSAAVLASEGTALDRLPPRIRVREAASLELPHIMIFIADEDETVIEPLANRTKGLEALYDFGLMEGGGRLRGAKISGSDSAEIVKALDSLHERKKAQSPPQCLMIMGDGNHSLAAAKSYWNEVKRGLTSAESESHPARYALVEINNLYDPVISFEAIHRVVFDINVEEFVSALSTSLISAKAGDKDSKAATYQKTQNDGFDLQILSLHCNKTITVSVNSASELIAAVQNFLDEYIERSSGRIDYIHDIDTLKKFAKNSDCVGILLPTISKQEFLDTVKARKIFPRKSFSVGHAEDKRYYMECRRIRI